MSNPKTFSEDYGKERRDSAVGIATGYGLDDQGVDVPVGVRIFTSPMSSRTALGSIHPPPSSFAAVKLPEREADHSTPISAEVKKTWLYTPTPPYVFLA
jgi:hypothetical protein